MNNHINAISGRLSLRAPQRESLERLARITEVVRPHGELDLDAALAAVRSEFPSVEDFERSFPSITFSLATGVGKTRLMGAFVVYLHLVHGIKNFFVLAPNLTIYNKLIADFTPGTPKYVFRGIAEFVTTPPTIITGDTYNELAATLFDSLSRCRINVFNISKINAEVRGGKAPRIKQLSEYIGQSYFDYLADLPDLVMLMDESHRYRASAGVRAINELKPVMGLELTATPFVETAKGPVRFKNVVYDYPLSDAMKDGFVKEPAVVTRQDFSPSGMTADAIEDMKLRDGIRLHEITKTELQTYAAQTGAEIVKPFVLIIARDTTHAAALLQKVTADDFEEGRYAGKAIQVDSSTKEEEVIARLLKVESADEPTEIVIHVNMLKEGWDVTNLYTIIPLRAASARILIEQSIGRGLRLPYGRRTGVEAVDTLSIVAHDRFQEIVDEARSSDSPIRLKSMIFDNDTLSRKQKTIVSQPVLATSLGIAIPSTTPKSNRSVTPATTITPIFTKPEEMAIAQAAYQAIRELGQKPEVVPTTAHLSSETIERQLVEAVQAQLTPAQTLLQLDDDSAKPDVAAIVRATVETVQKRTIDIPQILVVPVGEVQSGFRPFTLDVSGLDLSPVSETLWVQTLRAGEGRALSLSGQTDSTMRPEDPIVEVLSDFDDVSYSENADLLYDLAAQVVEHLRNSMSEADVQKVTRVHAKTIANAIHTQMQVHAWDGAEGGYEVKVSRGYTDLKPTAYTQAVNDDAMDYKISPLDKSNMARYLFGGFSRCLYEVQKFDSDTERIMSVILERDALRWFKPAKGQFSIGYRAGAGSGQYQPDFVAEDDYTIYMLEPKAENEMDDDVVQAKAKSAVAWCKNASDYSAKHRGKPWKYALIPHRAIAENKTLTGLVKEFGMS